MGKNKDKCTLLFVHIRSIVAKDGGQHVLSLSITSISTPFDNDKTR